MDYSWIWKAVLTVIAGTILLRLAGRKSISQMTLPQTVIMFTMGSLLVQPLSHKNIWITFGVGFILIMTLLVMEHLQLKNNNLEKAIVGLSRTVIENGQLQVQNMKKMRLTVDQLEMQLRQMNIARVEDVKWATLEANGRIGYMLIPEAQPVTRKEFIELRQDLHTLMAHLEIVPSSFNEVKPTKTGHNIFTEVVYGEHVGEPPKRLQ